MKKILSSVLLMTSSLSASYAYDYSSYSSKYAKEDYRTALNMGLKFFGGQRCGNTHNWMLHDNSTLDKDYCHTQDGKGKVNNGGNGNYDLTGGWHDCGDHIKVATTMGYAAVSLLVSYDLWPKAFQDNYDEAYGAPNGIPDVLDEVKVATDYFIKCFLPNGEFVYYVGFEGDHNQWVTSAVQSSLSVENGGDPRPVWTTSTSGGPQAANYSSALALMSILYPDTEYQTQCREAAVIAYEFAKKTKDKHASIPIFYSNPNQEWTDELALAAILMYRLTNNATYLDEAKAFLSGKWESNSPLAWDTVTDFAYYYLAKADVTANNGQGGTYVSFLEKNVFNLHLPAGEKDVNGFPYYLSNWGTNKLALGGAVSAALYIKLVEDGVVSTTNSISNAKNFQNRIVDYVLGANEFNHTFLHGFKGDMHFRIHHRNAMGRSDNPPADVKNRADYMFASGGVIGGPSSTGVFSNIIEGGSSYTETEGGCDYNAPFVAAIASIAAELDPNNSDIESVRSVSFNVYPTNFDDYIIIDPIENSRDGHIEVTMVDASGKVVLSMSADGSVPQVIDTLNLPKGIYIVNVRTIDGVRSYKVVK